MLVQFIAAVEKPIKACTTETCPRLQFLGNWLTISFCLFFSPMLWLWKAFMQREYWLEENADIKHREMSFDVYRYTYIWTHCHSCSGLLFVWNICYSTEMWHITHNVRRLVVGGICGVFCDIVSEWSKTHCLRTLAGQTCIWYISSGEHGEVHEYTIPGKDRICCLCLVLIDVKITDEAWTCYYQK